MSESKENLKKRIDTNKNQYIENNEVDNFAKDKKNGDIDLNNLGEYLNNLPLYNNDELKKALNNFFRSPERNKYDQTIKNKVTNNQPLDKTELSLMYLAMISEPNKHFTQQQLKFDSSKLVDQICDGALIGFIRTKYNFPTYTGKKVKIDLPNKTKKKTNNPIDKIQESKGGNIKLPENIGEIKESEADFYCDRLITRAEKNFANDIEKAKREIEQNHRYKDEEEKKAYIKRDTLLIAFSKYTEAINSQHEKHITNSGYKDKDDFENQMKLIEIFGKEIEKKYPNINNILEKIQKFDEEMKANEKKYFKNENETKKAEKNYKEFNEYMDKKSKEYDIDKIQESLKKEPNTKEEMEEYLQTMNKIFEFQEDLNKKNKTYGNSISKYQNYIKGAADIQKKHNIQQYQEILEKYNQDITNWNKKIDFKKYENYKNGLDWKLEVGIKNINTLQGIIKDPNKNKNILVKEFKDVEDKQQIKQNGIDRIRERIKKFSPGVYWTLTTFTGLWNGLIDATLGVSTSLGVMILGIIGGTDETLSQMDRKARRDNFFKIGQSSSQKESVYSPETGFNFHADNTVSTVASSISQMLTLIYGGGAIGSGASKVLGISENIAGRVGLFTSSFITQVGGSYQEAITHGLTGKNAIGYSFLSATIQSSLELISPNDVLLGKGNGIAKELIRNACNEGGKQSFMLIGKTFLKNVGLEIIEENIQEGLQTVAGNLINMVVDGAYGTKLGADWNWKNFASTAIITTLTTGITTGVSTGVQMYEMSNQDQTKLIEHIKSDNGLYLEVTGMLDKAIEGKVSIPNVNIEQLQNLKLTLTGNSNINTPSRNTNIQTDYEIKSSPEIEQISQILGSRFHEERKQSRLQSDGTYAPRVEKTSDQTWISKHKGQTEVDIANTPFEDLPSDWKSENLEAAKIAVGLIYDMVKKGEKVTSEMIEKMAEIVHNKRLERNGTEGSFENQRVPYEQLSESEKEKDRNQLLQAIETIEGLNKHEEVQNFIIEKLKKEECVEPIGGVNTIISYEDLSKQLIESALKNGLPNVVESIKNGNYEDSKIYELPKYQELLSKGFILPSDIRPYYKTKTGEQEYHLGIDYQVEVGKEVRAIYDGEVVESGYDGGLGNRIIIRHNTKEDGTGYNFYSLYGHLGKDELIPKGKLVEKGQKIGKVGNPKENGGWPSHLHFQIMERQDSPRGHLAVEGKGNYDVLTCFGKNEGIQNSGDNDNSDGKSLQSEITENEINETNKKTNVERLEELGIRIPEDSKESVNKMELDFKIIGNQNINNISPSDFEKLVDSHVEFSKSLITPELINKLLDTKNVGESRILIEKFSKNNDADLFNSMLKKREEKIIENINSRNGFISKYEQLATDLENFEYNENNIDEFRKILERHHNEIPAGFINYLLEIFPSKSDINETITYLNSTELSDIIIDYHFNDISYNIFLDIKELLNFQVSNGITIPIEHLKLYKNILDIDTLPTKEKIKLHNELKNKNVIEMFYNDYSSCRDRMYQEIADSILNKEKLEQFKDNQLSEQHGISVYKFDGQEFFALERESGVGLGEGVGLGNTGVTKGFSFSLVGKDCIGTRYSKNFGKPVNSFIYEGLNPQAIMHVFPKDSHTNSQYQPRKNDSNRHNFGQIVNTLMSPTELLKATQEYNEIFVLRNGNNGNQYQSIGEIKPIALYCYDEITPEDIETAKRENVGIMLIKTDAYKKNAVVSEWGENFIYDDHTYIDGKDRLDNAIYSRADITTFKKNEEFNDILNNVDNKSDYFDGKSHKIFKGDTTKAKLNSKTSDRILSEINEQNKFQKLEELRKEITEQYKQSTGEELQLSNEQLLSILDAHEQDGELGKLTIGQLKVKVKILSEAITDPKVWRFLLEAGFCGNENLEGENLDKNRYDIFYETENISEDETLNLEELNLTKEQIKNIKRIRDELGIEIDTEDNNEIKNIKLTQQQIKNIKTIRDKTGIKIYTRNINDIKDAKLTQEQIENIKNIVSIGIDLGGLKINRFKDIKLTPEENENIRNIINLGVKIGIRNIEATKNLKLTPEQTENIKKIANMGITIPGIYLNDIFLLTADQIENIRKIKDLGITINSRDIKEIKDIKLTADQIENIKIIRDLGININPQNIKEIKDTKLTTNQIENIKIIRDLGITINSQNIKEIKDTKLTADQIENIKTLKLHIEDEGTQISAKDIIIINDNPELFKINHSDLYKGFLYNEEEIDTHQNYTKGTIIEKIEQYVQEIIPEDRDIGKAEIINKIRPFLIILPKSERLKLLKTISDIVEKFNTVRKYINFESGPYKTPKELLCKMRGITDPNIISKITDNITVIQHGTGIHFFIGDKTSYQIIYDKSLTDSGERSGGFNDSRSHIEELRGTLSVINGINPGLNTHEYTYLTILHEGQHNRNSYFMSDKYEGPIASAKDEITAYLRDGRKINEIEEILTQPKSNGGLYQYDLEGEERENHKQQVKELLSYVENLIELAVNPSTGVTKDNVISMLSDTPVDLRKELHFNIMEATKLHLEKDASKIKIEYEKTLFIKFLKKLAQRKSINMLIEWWNSIFNDFKIKTEEFRRAGTEKKENEINEILKAENIEDVKHILNDPKYSHIGRGYDNKGGIEISTMIDEIIAGKTDIESIPEEIRNKIQTLITKGNNNDYHNGESHDEGLIFDSEYVTQKDDGIYWFNAKETTETQKNKPGYQSLQEAEQSLNNQIDGKYDKKLYQESFTKKHQNEDFEEDVDDFIKYATEKELNHKQIFLDLAKEAFAKALFIGGPKKKDRIIEKVRNELLKEGEGLEALTDFTRATILFDNFSDFEEGLKVLEKMKNEGRILDLKIRNRLTRPGCNDIFVNIQTPDGYVSEVQFHIPEVLVFRDEKLGDLSIDRYKSDNNILDKHTLTKDIFDLSNDKYKRNLEAYNKIIDRLNEGRDKDHLLSLPKEQDQIVYDHDMYDIIRVLEVYENADNLTLEDYELFTSKGFKHENIKDLLNDLRLMKEHLCNEALNRYRKRTK